MCLYTREIRIIDVLPSSLGKFNYDYVIDADILVSFVHGLRWAVLFSYISSTQVPSTIWVTFFLIQHLFNCYVGPQEKFQICHLLMI